jgi:tRNA threonylcarbamoyladenosine biosynthesis protein TsaB
MAYILCIETATSICSVALSFENSLIAIRESDTKNAHSSLVTQFILDVVEESKISINQLDAIAISKGPGSYTGLRIGVSSAKGLCYALEKPLISISTPRSMASGMIQKINKKFPTISVDNILLCPMIDARRMEVYDALYDLDNREVRAIEAEIIEKGSFDNYLKNFIIYFFGDGSVKCKNLLGHKKNARFDVQILPSASYMIPIAHERFTSGNFEDVAYFEPFYLKDFVAGKPKVKGLD